MKTNKDTIIEIALFQFRFANEPFFNQGTMSTAFKDVDDLKEYFLEFVKEYFKVHKKIEPMSKARMRGDYVDGYDDMHKYYHQLKTHYSMLLTVGTNGFGFFLNDILPHEYRTPDKKKRK